MSALIRLGNGAPGTIMATTASYPGGPERIEVIGTKGTAALIGGGLRVSLIDGGEEVLDAEGPTGSGANIMVTSRCSRRAPRAARGFFRLLQSGRDPAVSGEEALASQRLIADILAAASGPR